MFLTPTFTDRASSSFAWESLYCGYRYESATGVFHIRNRVYHPVVGTWVQRDPLGYVDGMGLYGYATQKTTTELDYDGRKCGIGYHCWDVVRFGLTIGRHCGVTVNTGEDYVWLDVLGGGSTGKATFRVTRLPLKDPSKYPRLSESLEQNYPDSTCDCINTYIKDKWDPAGITYSAGYTNSNFALKCLTKACNITITTDGRQVGWDCKFCVRGMGGAAGGCGVSVCLEYKECECP